MENEKIDDGSLEALNIKLDDGMTYFDCAKVSQFDLIGKTFWVLDYIGGVTTSHGSDRGLVKVKLNENDTEGDYKKFFTNSNQIKAILQQVKDMDKFPRRVTLFKTGKSFAIR